MKRLIMILPFLILGCNEEQATEAAIASPSAEVPPEDPGPSGPVNKTVTIWGGHGFECFLFNNVTGQVWCHEPFYPEDSSALNVNNTSFILIAEHSSNFYELLVKDDSICISGQASHSPYNEVNHASTYCIGQNTLSDPSGFMITSPFNNMVNGTPEIVWARAPFLGADLNITQLLATGTIGDDHAYVSSYDESCTLDNGILTCQSFTVDTN